MPPSLRRLVSRLVLAAVGLSAVPVAAAAPPAEPPAAAAGQGLAILLERMDPLDATRAASIAALSPRAELRRALGEALTWSFPLVGAAVVIDHLSRDPDPAVRREAARAALARRASGGDDGVLARLTADPDPAVREIALLAVPGR